MFSVDIYNLSLEIEIKNKLFVCAINLCSRWRFYERDKLEHLLKFKISFSIYMSGVSTYMYFETL
jgi:hypothetical protein